MWYNYTMHSLFCKEVFYMFQAPLPILLGLTVVTGSLMSILRGTYSKRYSMTGRALWRFNVLQSLICMCGIVTIYALSGTSFRFSLFSFGLGVAMAVCNVFSVYGTLKALSLGTFTYTTVIVSLSAIIPTLSGLFLGETIAPTQYIGIALMAVCIILSPEKTQNSKRTVNSKWLFWCAVSFVSSGGVGVIQKIHQKSAYRAEMPTLLLTGFALATVFALCMLKNSPKPSESEPQATPNKSMLWIPLLCGACFAFPHTINLVLAGRLPAVIMFPVVNLCPMMLSMIFAFVFFKERLSTTQWIGIGVGILSTVFVSGIISL